MRTRTADLFITSEPLYHLSYSGVWNGCYTIFMRRSHPQRACIFAISAVLGKVSSQWFADIRAIGRCMAA